MKIRKEKEKIIVTLVGNKSGIFRSSSLLTGLVLLVLFVMALFFFLFEMLPEFMNHIDTFGFFILLFMFGVVIVYFLASRNSIANAAKEYLEIREDALILGKSGIGINKETKIDLKEIESLGMAKEIAIPDHPLKTNPYDFIGVQAQQLVINNLFKEGQVELKCKGEIYRFGKNLYSWDVEELLGLIKEKTGVDLTPKEKPSGLFNDGPFYGQN